jgi:hypothetical protein
MPYSYILQTRNHVIYSVARLKILERYPRAAPVHVAKFSDEHGVGVKGLSNVEIAGFPRNLFR